MEPIKINMAPDKHFLLRGNKQVACPDAQSDLARGGGSQQAYPEPVLCDRPQRKLVRGKVRLRKASGVPFHRPPELAGPLPGGGLDGTLRLVAPSRQVENKDVFIIDNY
ncbi:MAG: hypothetical protein A4E53_02526 [Pelotomaculum sp. PtaB.Bin104]|nr:MAG: hypothetical protein A4E53_02526 [Pelotomaculum sp. PtaB.Bin104]